MCKWSDLATNWLKLDSNTLDNIVCEYPILLMHVDLLRIPHDLFTNKHYLHQYMGGSSGCSDSYDLENYVLL